MFANGSSSSMSLATVTPSCVTVGAPNFLSSATLRPLGPSVVATASATLSTPRCRPRRASSRKSNCFAIEFPPLVLVKGCDRNIKHPHQRRALGFDDAEDVALLEDEQLLAIELDFSAAILGIQHLVPNFHVHIDALACVIAAACADGEDVALLRFFLRGFW